MSILVTTGFRRLKLEEGSTMRLSEASEAFLAVRRQEGFSSHTIEAYRLQHKILIRDIGERNIHEGPPYRTRLDE